MELYDKTSDKFKDKVRKDMLWERFTSNHNLLQSARLGSTDLAMDN